MFIVSEIMSRQFEPKPGIFNKKSRLELLRA